MDEAYVPWLIEINSSPAVDYSTPVTERYCGTALADGVKVRRERHDRGMAGRMQALGWVADALG